ncbi:metalloendopeptidase [Dipsacomyces acuminosporus]|nr:metalloendopeptidase [Dipsacomyces acuminosporus]
MASRAQRLVKGSVLNFVRTPAHISASIRSIISRGKEVQDAVASQKAPTFSNTVAPLAMFENDHGAESSIVTFLQNVSTDKAVRDASSRAEQELRVFHIESMMRQDVYKSVKSVFDNKDELSKLDPEDRRLVEKLELQFRRNGLALSEDQRKKLGEIRKRLSEISIAFARNVNEGDGRILLTREELDGLPDDYFEGRPTEVVDGTEKYVVTTKYPDLVPAMQLARREDARMRLLLTEETRCPDNVALLQEAVKLRLEAARLLGYKTHAELVLEENMAKTPGAVIEFENDLRKRLDVLAKKELKEIEEMKRADNDAAGTQYEGLFKWDYRYYANLLKERKHSINDEEVKQYFPVEQVTRGVLDIYQNMLGLKFVKVESPHVWHPDVDMYEIWEAAGDRFVGHFYLDLYPRDGKYNHACVNPIRSGFTHPDGMREYPAAAMLANFPKPTPSAPALLKHDDVLTLLHEFGHIFHHICAETKWAHFSLDSVQMDFIEAPSQLLENWGWEPSVLRQFAVHYKSGEPIPDELVRRLVAAQNEGAGLFNLRQVFFGMYDMAIHNTEDGEVDVKALYTALREQITLFANGPHDTNGPATFGHMMGGYDAGYYGYLWAKVFSSDMFASRFLKEGVDDPRTGLDYRHEILAPGGSRDASISLEKFLGRQPSNRAFIKSIGLDQD